MIALTFGRRLNAESWAAAFTNHHLFSGKEWPTNLDGLELSIDLSATGFADFVALGQLLVFIDTATTSGARVSVLLPTPERPDGEDPRDHEAARRRRQRENCRLFLSQSGFENALTAGPWPESAVRVLEGQAPALTSHLPDRSAIDGGAIEELKTPQRLRKVVRYQWIAPSDGMPSSIRALQNALHDLGLPSEDSAALANGVLAELIENVKEHAQWSPERPTMALVGAAVIWPQRYKSRENDFAPTLREFVRWAAGVGSPLVRLVVADSGRGVSPSSEDSLQRAVLRALDRRITTVTPGVEFRPNLRGLWKVQRIVRGYQGSMLIATNGVTAGRVFSDSPQGRDITDEAPAWLPGVIVECDVLARPDIDVAQSDEEVSTPARQRAGRLAALECMDVTLHPSGALDPLDRDRICEFLTGLRQADDVGLVIVVDTPRGDDEPNNTAIRSFLGNILRIAAAPVEPACIAVVFPSINRRLLSLAVEELNAADGTHGGEHGSEHSTPILLVAPGHRHYWLGGTGSVRSVLRSLSSLPGPVPLDVLLARTDSDLRPLEGIQQLRDTTSWLQMHADDLALRLRPQDAIDAIVDDLADKLKHAISYDDSSGVFLTPTLRLVSRWCSIPDILSDMRAERRAGFALAARVEASLGRFDGPLAPPSVLQVGSATHQLMSSFAMGVTGATQYFDSVRSLRATQALSGSATPTRVLLITDLISTGTTLADTFAELVSHDVQVVAVATVVDARATTSGPVGDEITSQGVALPLIRLTSVDIEPLGSVPQDEVVPIDPVHRQPVRERIRGPHVLVPQSYYIDTLKRVGAARLGHIGRPAGRHYTAHVDPTMLFRDESWAMKVTRLAARKITESHRQVFRADAPNAPICILYPTETVDDLEQVARGLHEVLRNSSLRTTGVLPAQRAVLGTQWMFPPSVPMPSTARHIVFVDGSSHAGRTVQQLIRLAATSHAEAITGVILLNGLTDLDALALQQIRTVARHGPNMPQLAPATSHDIPVGLHFMARTATSSVDARDCPVCEMQRTYANLPLLVPVPPQIERQREWLMRSLELRSMQGAFQEEPTDLLGANISQDDCVRYLRWRFELREAASDTLRRQEVVRKIAEAAEDPRQRDALVRLLTAERQWLKSAPLWFPEVRERVAGITSSMLAGESAASIDPVLRVQAVILMASVASGTLVEQFRSIVSTNRDQTLILGQVMLELLRLTIGHDGWWPRPPDRQVQDLGRNLVAWEHELWEQAQVPGADSAPISLPDVQYLISHSRRKLQPVPKDPQGAWAVLRTYRQKVVEHNYDNPMWRLLQTLSNLRRGVPPESPEEASDDWRRCRDVLTFHVLPSIRLLRHPLLSSRITSRLSPDDKVKWEQVVNGNGVRELDQIEIDLNTALYHPSSPPRTAEHSVEDLRTNLSWWNRFFLGTHPEPGKAHAALLIEIVERCPVEFFDVVESVFADADWESVPAATSDGPTIRRARVFATANLLNDVFTHIRRNAEETHRLLSNDTGAATRIPVAQRFSVEVREDEGEYIRVTVRNTGSEGSGSGRRKGLATLAAELEAFGGRLEDEKAPPPPYTYGIDVFLERWRMV
jgi:hypothetical protein